MNMTHSNLRSILSREIILRKLETIYWQAVRDKKWNVALQTVIMQGREINMFVRQNLPVVVRIKDMTEEQLDDFIAYLEEHDPELRPPEDPSPEAPEETEVDRHRPYLELVHPPPSISSLERLGEHSVNNPFE